jgi:hypothetical protein
MDRAPITPIIIIAIEMKRLLPDGSKIMIKERRRTEIVTLAISSILYRRSLLILYFFIMK